jgi:hypothetical protein
METLWFWRADLGITHKSHISLFSTRSPDFINMHVISPLPLSESSAKPYRPPKPIIPVILLFINCCPIVDTELLFRHYISDGRGARNDQGPLLVHSYYSNKGGGPPFRLSATNLHDEILEKHVYSGRIHSNKYSNSNYTNSVRNVNF